MLPIRATRRQQCLFLGLGRRHDLPNLGHPARSLIGRDDADGLFLFALLNQFDSALGNGYSCLHRRPQAQETLLLACVVPRQIQYLGQIAIYRCEAALIGREVTRVSCQQETTLTRLDAHCVVQHLLQRNDDLVGVLYPPDRGLDVRILHRNKTAGSGDADYDRKSDGALQPQ